MQGAEGLARARAPHALDSLRILGLWPIILGIQFRMQVADALRERAQRIYEKYGNVMLETEGMTKAGIERKATCRALFSKLLYLAGEWPAVYAQEKWEVLSHLNASQGGSALIGAPEAVSS